MLAGTRGEGEFVRRGDVWTGAKRTCPHSCGQAFLNLLGLFLSRRIWRVFWRPDFFDQAQILQDPYVEVLQIKHAVGHASLKKEAIPDKRNFSRLRGRLPVLPGKKLTNYSLVCSRHDVSRTAVYTSSYWMVRHDCRNNLTT
jgi:hypothetical protein